MPRSENQKLKLLYLLKFLYEQTDEEHTATVNDMIAYLAKNGIVAERRAIYDDLRLLEEFGVNIIKRKSKTHDYFIGERLFELAELKILIDAVQASKFITQKKSAALIKKLEGLAGKHRASKLSRQVYLTERIKSMNESVYYTVDAIYEAISENRRISFCYFDYDIRKERVYRRNKREYICNPVALTFDNGNYYLIDYNEKYGNLAHYRVDKMSSISVLDQKRAMPEKRVDIAEYVGSMFSMYGGKAETVTAEFQLSLLGAVYDRFGHNLTIVSSDIETFRARFKIAIGSAFKTWMIGFGKKARVISPESVRADIRNMIEEAAEIYK